MPQVKRITEGFQPIASRTEEKPYGYKLVDDTLHWECGWEGSGFDVFIEPGYVFDYSVPPWLIWLRFLPFIGVLFNPHDTTNLLSSAVHDKLDEAGADIPFSSAEIRRVQIARGRHWFLANIVYRATMTWLQIKKLTKRESTDDRTKDSNS